MGRSFLESASLDQGARSPLSFEAHGRALRLNPGLSALTPAVHVESESGAGRYRGLLHVVLAVRGIAPPSACVSPRNRNLRLRRGPC